MTIFCTPHCQRSIFVKISWTLRSSSERIILKKWCFSTKENFRTQFSKYFLNSPFISSPIKTLVKLISHKYYETDVFKQKKINCKDSMSKFLWIASCFQIITFFIWKTLLFYLLKIHTNFKIIHYKGKN